VRASEHRDVAVLASHLGERVPEFAEFREEDVRDGTADEQAVREVVDVLAREPEVNPVRGVQVRGQVQAHVVLDGFHVVVRRRELAVALGLDLLDDLGVLDRPVLVARTQLGGLRVGDLERRRVEVAEGEEMLDFDLDASAHER
jgi:hypothetical protein